jgi:hypothetical protein
MKKGNMPRPVEQSGRRRFGRSQWDHILDPYKRVHKLDEPTVCPQCGAVYHEARWHWAPRPVDAHEELCQACHRINDKYPAGVVTLTGSIVQHQKAEITALVHHQEQAEKKEHPLNRIMSILETADSVVINTTDIHLPMRIGRAIKRAFHGELNHHFDEHGYFLRVNWHEKNTG